VERQPSADLRAILPAAFVEAAILILSRGGVPFGLGVAQQDQTAHIAISFRWTMEFRILVS
jgi:hypothetical protein